MTKKYNLNFIANRITEIGSALMHDLRDSNEPVTTGIINVLKVEEDGKLWFFIRRPFGYADESSFAFPVALQFIRKGMPFYIKVTGVATATGNYAPVEGRISDEVMTMSIASNLTLVEMKIEVVEYCEYDESKKEDRSVYTFFQNLYRHIFLLPDYNRQVVARFTLN
ncbi:MAG: hypothetical protein H7Y31_08775 [Chitinophagaceae bacterium]|nr:hypothetical protein [Chitinophagaceae bacterium]